MSLLEPSKQHSYCPATSEYWRRREAPGRLQSSNHPTTFPHTIPSSPPLRLALLLLQQTQITGVSLIAPTSYPWCLYFNRVCLWLSEASRWCIKSVYAMMFPQDSTKFDEDGETMVYPIIFRGSPIVFLYPCTLQSSPSYSKWAQLHFPADHFYFRTRS